MVKSVPSQWLQENKWVKERTGKDKFMASGDNQRGGQAQITRVCLFMMRTGNERQKI